MPLLPVVNAFTVTSAANFIELLGISGRRFRNAMGYPNAAVAIREGYSNDDIICQLLKTVFKDRYFSYTKKGVGSWEIKEYNKSQLQELFYPHNRLGEFEQRETPRHTALDDSPATPFDAPLTYYRHPRIDNDEE